MREELVWSSEGGMFIEIERLERTLTVSGDVVLVYGTDLN